MTKDETRINGVSTRTRPPLDLGRKNKRKKRALLVSVGALSASILIASAAAWTMSRADVIDRELNAALQLASPLKQDIVRNDAESAADKVEQISRHTGRARDTAGDPLWTLATAVPGLGANFSAVTEMTRSADDVANLGLKPLMKAYGSLNWDSAVPSVAGTDLKPLQEAAPMVSSAAHAVRVSAERLGDIDSSNLLPQVATPLEQARMQLQEVTGTLDSAADASGLLPQMLGVNEPRSYLLMVQNNAEIRASGGIPGALAVLQVDNGKLSLGRQSSAGEVGIMTPPLAVEPTQQQIYSGRLGKFLQDVNLTPDFPTAANTAKAMWERKFGERVDGVISIDPVVLSYILDATGPIRITTPDLGTPETNGLPTELDGRNVVPTLLSDVYAKIEQPEQQDAYFALVAKQIFSSLADGNVNGKGLVDGITRGSGEGRVLVWSDQPIEQSTLNKYAVSGSVSGPSVLPAQFGVYFNDGTGAKMDFHVHRTVQLIQECPKDGYEQTTVRITSTNNAPMDAATSLPSYVTGNGAFGVPPGSVQTNVVAYGPNQALVESSKVDGTRTDFASYVHNNRPVGVVAVRIAPGESKSVDFTFTKIVQHTEPNVVVTPTVQAVKDVTLPTEKAVCSS